MSAKSDLLQGVPLRAPASSPVWNLTERAVGFLLLAATAPAGIVAGIAIAVISRRSPLIAHARVGWCGKPLWMLKFRTMWDSDGAGGGGVLVERIAERYEAKAVAAERVKHPLARWMRRYSMDEVPQLWHVVTGEMSLVGPRPITREEMEEHYGEAAGEVTSIRPGMTGLWQVMGRSRLSYRQRLRYDLFLVRKQNPGLTARILLRTLPAVLRGENSR